MRKSIKTIKMIEQETCEKIKENLYKEVFIKMAQQIPFETFKNVVYSALKDDDDVFQKELKSSKKYEREPMFLDMLLRARKKAIKETKDSVFKFFYKISE